MYNNTLQQQKRIHRMVIRINKVNTLIFQKNGNRKSFQKITLNQTGFLVSFMHSEKLGQKIGGFMAEL